MKRKRWIIHDPYECPMSCSDWYDVNEIAEFLDLSPYCLNLMQDGGNFMSDDGSISVSCHEYTIQK